eukprot:PhF_6_TR40425/c0_g1_i1/m.60267/K01613/psd, PISD; phosphatidylserine decarboxylase
MWKSYLSNHSDKHWQNPLRRWVVHKAFFATTFIGIPTYLGVGYSYACWQDPSPNTFGSPLTQSILYSLPLNIMSRFVGHVACDEKHIPTWVHHKMIRTLIQMYKIDMSQYDPQEVEEYSTTQEFFVRKKKEDIGNRFRRSSEDHEVLVASPCDAELISYTVIPNNKCYEDIFVEHIKGDTFRLSSLFELPLGKTNNPAVSPNTTERALFVFHLRPSDYHRFHSPIPSWTVTSTVHVPGALFPVTYGAFKWIPRLLVANERVVMEGNHNSCTMVAVGATNVGSVVLPWERRIQTNNAESFATGANAVVRSYQKGQTFRMGDEVGWFEFGSCIVLMVDVETAGGERLFTVRESVECGQPLIVRKKKTNPTKGS